MCSGGGQQRDFAALFRYRRCISSSGGIFRFKAVCVVMCSGGGQQRDFATLFRCRRCISTLVGIFRFKRGFVSLCVRAAVSSAISPLCSVTDGAFLPRAASSGLKRFVSLCVRAAVSSAISPLCSVADGAFLPWSASSGLNAALCRYVFGRRSAARFRRFVPLPTVHFYPGRHLPI